MKGLVLSGGAGTRLRPITHTSAKQLVPVANKPILFYGLEHLAEAGVVEVGIVVGDTADEIRDAVGDGSRWGLKVTYIPQDEPLGLAHCLQIAREFLGGDDFVMYLGDNLLGEGLVRVVEEFRNRQVGLDGRDVVAQILLTRVPDPERFGVAELDEHGEVVRLVEKPAVPRSDLALTGVYLFDATVHEAVDAITPSARGELEITDAISWLLRAGHHVRHQVVDGWWKDTGELEALLEGNRLVLETLDPRVDGTVDDSSRLEGRVVIEEGAEIIRSTVRGPAIIGERTRVIDSFIGPFSAVYHDCVIEHSELQHSIVLERSLVRGIAGMTDSLVGKEVEVTRTQRRPRAIRVMLGDHSKVDLP